MRMRQTLCPQLVGRRDGLDVLTRALSGGSGGVVAVVGEAGLGKSRLVRETLREARVRGVVEVCGRAVEAPGLPYRALTEALMSACRRSGLPSGAELAPYRTALGRLLPEWRSEATRWPESPLVLAEGVLRLLKALGGDGGTLFAIEDLHWVDRETLGVLEYVADHADEERLTVVLTARPGSSPGTTLLHQLVDRRIATSVELSPMSEEDVATMAQLCLDAPLLPTDLSGLLARADGIPFLVEELLAAAIDAGALARKGKDWVVRSVAEPLIPRTFADSVRRRLEDLSPCDREVVELGALLGQLDPALLGGALDRTTPEVAGVLEQAAESQLVALDDGQFRFRHALTRDAVLTALIPEARAGLARRARSAVATVHPGLPGRWRLLAAELSRLAGDPRDAAQLLLMAGAHAADDGALTTAAELLGQAAALVQPASVLAQDVEQARARVAGLSGDLDTAASFSRDVLAQSCEPSRRFDIHLQLAEAASSAAQWDRAEEELAAARPDAPDQAAGARVDALAAHVLLGRARLAEAEAHAQRALNVAQRQHLTEVTCQALEVLGRIARNRDLDDAMVLFDRQRQVASRQGASLWELRATHELGTLDLIRENRTDRLRRASELANQAGALSLAATIDLQVGVSGWVAFDAATCLAQARRCQDAARRLHLDLLLAEGLLLEAAGHGFAGRRAAMELAIADALSTGRSEADLEATAWAYRGTFFLLQEDRAGARDAFDRAVSILRGAPVITVRPYWWTWALLRTVQDDGGDEARAEAQAYAQSGSWPAQAVLAYGEAIAAGRRGEGDRAEVLVGEARAQLAAPRLAAERHLVERLVAECALADGWGEPVPWLTDAAIHFGSSGHPHVERACRSLLRRAGVSVRHRARSPDIPRAWTVLGVTDREADVLVLVAEGLTSREIADRLFISVRTVDKHVEHLLEKTGSTRRTELRAFCT